MDPKENFPEQAVDLEREQPVNPVRDSGVVDEEAAAGDEKNQETEKAEYRAHAWAGHRGRIHIVLPEHL
jgi:hypothetical protein